MDQKTMHEGGDKCACPHHRALPGAVLLIGVLFLLQGLGVLNSGFVGIAWPILLIAGAGSKMGMCKCC